MNSHAFTQIFASAISVDFDLTFLAQFVLFTAFVSFLKPLLFDPLLRVFEERERRIEGAKEKARRMDVKAGDLMTRYEGAVAEIRVATGIERDKLRADTARLEAQIMAEARAEAARILEVGKARIAAEVAELRKELDATKPALAAQIASRIIGREISQ